VRRSFEFNLISFTKNKFDVLTQRYSHPIFKVAERVGILDVPG
jgi:hypothetical protein